MYRENSVAILYFWIMPDDFFFLLVWFLFLILPEKLKLFLLLFFFNFVLLFLVWRENPKTLMCTSTFMLFPPFPKPQSLQQTEGSVSWKLAGIKQFGKATRKTKILFPSIPWEFIWKTHRAGLCKLSVKKLRKQLLLKNISIFIPVFADLWVTISSCTILAGCWWKG